MNKSEQMNELATALNKAQHLIHNAKEDSRGNFGEYASFASVRKALQQPFHDHGLSYCQLLGKDGGGDYLETLLLHTSGQWLSSRLYLRLDKTTMQGLGSAITYARRYSIAALAGIDQEDDDGQGAENEAKQPARPQASRDLALPISPDTFVFNFGKHRGKKFAELPFEELAQYMNWLASQKDSEKHKPIFQAFNQFKQKIQFMPQRPPVKRTPDKEPHQVEMPEKPAYMKDEEILNFPF